MNKRSVNEPLVEESIKPAESKAEPHSAPDDPKTISLSESTGEAQESQQYEGGDQIAPTAHPSSGVGDQRPTISLISQDKFKAQINALRESPTIKNVKGEEVTFEGEEVTFEGEDKEQFIHLAEEAYPVAEKLAMTMTETGRFLHKVRDTLKPKKLFLRG